MAEPRSDEDTNIDSADQAVSEAQVDTGTSDVARNRVRGSGAEAADIDPDSAESDVDRDDTVDDGE